MFPLIRRLQTATSPWSENPWLMMQRNKDDKLQEQNCDELRDSLNDLFISVSIMIKSELQVIRSSLCLCYIILNDEYGTTTMLEFSLLSFLSINFKIFSLLYFHFYQL